MQTIAKNYPSKYGKWRLRISFNYPKINYRIWNYFRADSKSSYYKKKDWIKINPTKLEFLILKSAPGDKIPKIETNITWSENSIGDIISIYSKNSNQVR